MYLIKIYVYSDDNFLIYDHFEYVNDTCNLHNIPELRNSIYIYLHCMTTTPQKWEYWSNAKYLTGK